MIAKARAKIKQYYLKGKASLQENNEQNTKAAYGLGENIYKTYV